MRVTPDRLQWLAAFVDGEGSVGRSGIRATSTDLDILEKAARYSGGGTIVARPPDPRGNRKPAYTWTLGWGQGAADVLTQLMPLLCHRKAAKGAYVLYARGLLSSEEYEVYLHISVSKLYLG